MTLPKIEFIKFQALLLCLVILLIVSPVIEEVGGTGLAFSILLALVIIVSVIHASQSVLQRYMAIFLALIWMIVTFTAVNVHPAVSPALVVLLLIHTVKVMLQKIFKTAHVDTEILCASLSIYLLFGVIWAMLYTVTYRFAPGAFILPDVNTDYVSIHFLYYSFGTLTTLGYGDILPISPTARMLAATEAVTGVLYLAVLVARLIGMYNRKP